LHDATRGAFQINRFDGSTDEQQSAAFQVLVGDRFDVGGSQLLIGIWVWHKWGVKE
jgi:hypothetical protein